MCAPFRMAAHQEIVGPFFKMEGSFCSSESAEALPQLCENDPTDLLSRIDAEEYRRLRESFSSPATHDRHQATFQQEIKNIIQFVERSKEGREERALAAGLVYTGTYFCVNTQQLKKLIGRCKSSINSGFQQMGFLSMKMKTRARSCLLAALPSLLNDTGSSRQWTVRAYSSPGLFAMKQGIIHTVALSPTPVLIPAIMPEFQRRQPLPAVQEPHRPTPLPVPIISVNHLNQPASAPLKRSELTESIQKPGFHQECVTDDEFQKNEVDLFAEFGGERDPDDSFAPLCWY